MSIRSGFTRHTLHRGLLAGCLLGAGGCDLVRDPTAFEIDDGSIAVHGMVVAGERHIAVLVTRYESMNPADAFTDVRRIVPVADAEVRVSSVGQSITLRNEGAAERCLDDSIYSGPGVAASLEPGCYTGLAENVIAAGATYELDITLHDGAVITGVAEVPKPTTIRTPEAGSDLEVRWRYDENDPPPPHPLAWTDPGPDRAVRLRLEADSCGPPRTTHEPVPGDLGGPWNGSLSRVIDLTGRDSASVGGWLLLCEERPTGPVHGALQLAVFDLAYAQYLDTLARDQSVPLADASVGLSGAVGAFTGVAITRQPVRLIVR